MSFETFYVMNFDYMITMQKMFAFIAFHFKLRINLIDVNEKLLSIANTKIIEYFEEKISCLNSKL